MSSQNDKENSIVQPVVTSDPRFHAGRQLVQKGLAKDGAIEIFATLVEEATTRYGESSIETAPAYYEYGNALLRGAHTTSENEEGGNEAATTTKSNPTVREAAAAAAERRRQKQLQQQTNNQESDQKPAAPVTKLEESEVKEDASTDSKAANVIKKETLDENSKQENCIDGEESSNIDSSGKKPAPVVKSSDVADVKGDPANDKDESNENDDSNVNNDDDDDDDDDGNSKDGSTDLNLSLEMMENAYSILDEYHSKKDEETKYNEWTKQQIPRVLLGIGDVLSALNRHADAADAYSRALELRQEELKVYTTTTTTTTKELPFTIERLQAHRRVVEATVLIAEELLACPSEQDVVTTETNTLIVKANERIEYARGYYDKARDALQDTVFVMGNLAGCSKGGGGEALVREKEDVCFIATMVMGVGTALAELDEQIAEQKNSSGSPPPLKKQKQG